MRILGPFLDFIDVALTGSPKVTQQAGVGTQDSWLAGLSVLHTVKGRPSDGALGTQTAWTTSWKKTAGSSEEGVLGRQLPKKVIAASRKASDGRGQAVRLL